MPLLLTEDDLKTPYIPAGCDQQSRDEDAARRAVEAFCRTHPQPAEAATEIGAEAPASKPLPPAEAFWLIVLLSLTAWGVLVLLGSAARAAGS